MWLVHGAFCLIAYPLQMLSTYVTVFHLLLIKKNNNVITTTSTGAACLEKNAATM